MADAELTADDRDRAPQDLVDEWLKATLENAIKAVSYGNSPLSKVLVLTMNRDTEKDLFDRLFKGDPATDEVKFRIESLNAFHCDDDGIVIDLGEFEKRVKSVWKEWKPTIVVMSYNHGVSQEDLEKETMPDFLEETVPQVLNRDGKIDWLYGNINYLLFKTCDVYYLEECLLFSTTVTTGTGIVEELADLAKEGVIQNDEKTRLVIISGGHGSNTYQGGPSPTGGKSCYSCVIDLEYKNYEEDCAAFGFRATDDPCDYPPGSWSRPRKIPSGVNLERVSKFINDPFQRPSMENPRRNERNQDDVLTTEKVVTYMNKMKVTVLNMANYHKSTDGRLDLPGKANANGIDFLLHELKSLDPTHIAIAWCFTSNDDLAMALRAKGFFSKMLLNHDLRKLTGNRNARLSEQQAQILEDAALLEKRHFFISGPKGSGKSILAAEIAKIKYAKLIDVDDKSDVRIDVKLGASNHACLEEPCVCSRRSSLATTYEDTFFVGFGEKVTIKNTIRKGVFKPSNGGHAYEEEHTWNDGWLMEQMKLKESTRIIILDDWLDPHGELGHYDMTSLPEGARGFSIFCTSLRHRSYDKGYLERVGWYMCPHLKTSYRYAREIGKFLQFYSKEIGRHEERSENLKKVGAFPESSNLCPKPLSQVFKHPVIWLHLEDITKKGVLWNERKKILEDMCKAVSKHVDDTSSTLGVTDLYGSMESSHTFILGRGGPKKFVNGKQGISVNAEGETGPCDGAEADIVIVILSWIHAADNSQSLEMLSRARKQLFIIPHGKFEEAWTARGDHGHGDFYKKVVVTLEELKNGHWLNNVKT